MRKLIKLYIVLFFLVTAVFVISFKKYYVYSNLFIEVIGPVPDTYQIFYNIGRRFNEYDSKIYTIVENNDSVTLRFPLPAKKIRSIRIDPGTHEGVVKIKTIFLETEYSNYNWSPEQIKHYSKPMHQISDFTIQNGLLFVKTSGNDPYFKFDPEFNNTLDKKIANRKKFHLYVYTVIAAIIIFFLIMLIEYLKYNFIDKSKLTVIEYIVKYRYLLAFIIFIVLVMGKFHGSSMAEWDRHIIDKTDNYRRTLLLGVSRPIRSDEYLVQTPMYIAQTQNEKYFPVINMNIRSDGQNMLLIYYAPVCNVATLSKPQNWGFMFFGKEYGLSWYWYSRLLLLLLVTFELCMIITKQNILISMLGALWITFSPGIQWWYSTHIVDLLIYSQAIITAIWYYTKGVKFKGKILLTLILCVSITGFTLEIYPPFQVPLGFFILIFLIGILYENRRKIKVNTYDYFFIVFVLLFVGYSLYSFITKSSEAIAITEQTVYPGRRFTTGGGYDIKFLQTYLIDWLLPYKQVNFLNSCELSTFLNFLPALIIIFFKIFKLEKRKLLFSLLFIFLLFQLSWLVVKYPSWIAKITLFFNVPPFRMHIMVSLTASYLSIWAFSLIIKHRPFTWYESLGITSFVAIIYVLSIVYTPMKDYLGFLSTISILLLFFSVMNFSLIYGLKKLFSVLLIVYLLVAGLPVNPLSCGLDSVFEKTITKKILNIKKEYPQKKWAAVNSMFMGNLLAMIGVKTFNCIHLYPDLKMWKLLDPDERYENIYNRYAHVELRITDEKTYFKLVQNDVFTVYLSINDLEKTGIKYIISKGVLKGFDKKLSLIDKVENDELYIYEVCNQ